MPKKKIKEWLSRYLPAEIIGTITALIAACVTQFFYQNLVFTAYIGSFGEAFGFYSTILIRNILTENKKHKIEKKVFSFSDFTKIVAHIVLEFGPAGIIDGLILRPFFMYLFPVILKNFTLGIFIGKITGDFTFYFLVILSYEMKNRIKNKKININGTKK